MRPAPCPTGVYKPGHSRGFRPDKRGGSPETMTITASRALLAGAALFALTGVALTGIARAEDVTLTIES